MKFKISKDDIMPIYIIILPCIKWLAVSWTVLAFGRNLMPEGIVCVVMAGTSDALEWILRLHFEDSRLKNKRQ